MKVVTLFGTRPEIIRLSKVIHTLDGLCEHTLVYTGQNYDPNLSDLFFSELGVRHPDVHLGIRSAGFGEQAGQIISRSSEVLERVRPDRLLILGDTNSGLASIVAARMGIPVYHMEAGNRGYDNRVPEEINRRIIDHSSTILMPYTHRSKDNLVREGIQRERIFVTGNPIYEVLNAYRDRIDASTVLHDHELEPGGYSVVTMHRTENVDDPVRLASLVGSLDVVADELNAPMIVSLHPRTASRMSAAGIAAKSPHVQLLQPLGLFDFVKLEKHARIVLSDSGTVQEECCILQVPSVVLRDVTERPETVECGSTILAPATPDGVLSAVQTALALPGGWTPPPEYLEPNVSRTVAKILLGHSQT